MTNRTKKKYYEKNPPGSAEELAKDPDWEETTHPDQAKKGNRTFENKKTGEKVRHDKGKAGQSGHKGRDHYHRYNPRRTGKNDKYLDSDGNPVHKNDEKSHLYLPEEQS